MKACSSVLSDFITDALTPHIMKNLEWPLLHLLRPLNRHAPNSLQFASQEKMGVEDAILYLQHRVDSHLDKGSSAVRIVFFFFSSAFSTIQSPPSERQADRDESWLKPLDLDQRLCHRFYRSAVTSILFCAVVCWRRSFKKGDAMQLDRRVRRAGFVLAK